MFSGDYAVVVFRLTDETAFMYMTDKSFGGEYSHFDLLNEWQYHTILIEEAANVTNLKREALSGWDVIYGELDNEDGHLKFWYSEHYGIMMKYIVDSTATWETTFEVTSIEILDSIDPALFEKPNDIQFFDLGDLEGSLVGDTAG